MADDQLATLVTRSGGLGLSRGLADQLMKQVHAAGLIAAADSAVKRVDQKEVAGE
jgi:Rod binding domain-containing protein